MTPPDDPPEPDLSEALPCICGHGPEWEWRKHPTEFRLYCFRHGTEMQGDWHSDIDIAIRSWDDMVVDRGDDEGDARKAEGQDSVATNNEDWLNQVLSAISFLAASGKEFTVEDVRHFCNGLGHPTHPNAWGAAFSRAARQGLIVRTGYRKNGLPSAHARVVATWKGVTA